MVQWFNGFIAAQTDTAQSRKPCTQITHMGRYSMNKRETHTGITYTGTITALQFKSITRRR